MPRKSSESRARNLKRYWSNEDMRKKQSIIVKLAMADPKIRQKISERTKLAMASPEIRSKMSKNIKKGIANMSEAKKQQRCDKYKENLSKA